MLATAALGAEQSTWTLEGNQTLRIDASGEPKKLVDASGAVLAEFSTADVVNGSVLSEHHKCLVLLVDVERLSERRPNTRYFDYGYLLRVTSGSAGWHVTRILDHSLPPMGELHRTVSELGAVSDDGRTALVKFGIANCEQAPYTMLYGWQTWDLETPKVLGTGLRIENGQR